MAENFTKGVDGAIYIGGALQGRINSWTMTMTAPVEDVTNFSADGQQNEYTGHANFTGSLSGQTLRSDSATTQEMQAVMETFANGGTLAAVQLKLIESTKAMYWGNVLITNIGKDAGAQGLQTYSADWVPSTGRLKFATSTST